MKVWKCFFWQRNHKGFQEYFKEATLIELLCKESDTGSNLTLQNLHLKFE